MAEETTAYAFLDTNAGADEWDSVKLGGEWLPGVWDVKVTTKRDVQLKKSKDKSGETMEDQGNVSADVVLTGQLWTAAQWREWLRIMPAIQPRRPDAAKEALELVHPEANSKGVTAIVVREIPPYGKDKGILTITLNAVEWQPAPKPVKKGSGGSKSTVENFKTGITRIVDAGKTASDWIGNFWD